MKHILISERTWHFKLYMMTYKVNGKLPIYLSIIDEYLIRVMFFWLIVPYCWITHRVKSGIRGIKNARWKHMPRVEFVEVEDSRSATKEFIDIGERR